MTSSNTSILRVRQSLRLSILSGFGWACTAGLTQSYITPFAIELKASTFQIGLLMSVPSIAMALSQLFSPQVTEIIGSRKRITLTAMLIESLMWLPIMLIPFIFKQHSVWFLIMFLAILTTGGSIGGPAWSSLMAELVPPDIRGRYFSWRGMLVQTTVIIFSFIAMGIMEFYKHRDIFMGFSILFGGAVIFRLGGAYFFVKMYEPPMPQRQSDSGLWNAIRHIGVSDFGRFTILMCIASFIGSLAAPFYAVFLYRDLKFDFLPYIIVMTAAGVFLAIFQPFWGRRADAAGNAKILKMILLVAPIGSILWILSSNVVYLVGVQALGGFFLAGMSLATGNYLMDQAKPEDVTRNMAIFNSFSGVSVFLGASLGGIIASRLPPVFGYPLRTLFLLQGILSLVIGIVSYKYIKEVRKVVQVGTLDLLLGKFPGKAKKTRGKSAYGFHIMPEISDEELSDKHDESKG